MWKERETKMNKVSEGAIKGCVLRKGMNSLTHIGNIHKVGNKASTVM